MRETKRKKKEPPSTILLVVLLSVLIGIAVVSGLKLFCYYADYSRDRDLYQALRDNVIEDNFEKKDVKSKQVTEEIKEDCKNELLLYQKKLSKHSPKVPLTINWERLQKINDDIIGWVYFTGLPQISYPILQAEDNDYYVHRTFDLSDNSSKAGSIFMDYRMECDFSSPYSVIYGHNVRDGSMLSDLALLKDQRLYDEEPYFWILTPNGNYRYQIFSIFQCYRSADVFQEEFDSWGIDFLNWQTTLKARNVMQSDVNLFENGHVIAFSTCVPNSYDRTIVCGMYIDGDKIPNPHPASK